jgi:hypothetical protein
MPPPPLRLLYPMALSEKAFVLRRYFPCEVAAEVISLYIIDDWAGRGRFLVRSVINGYSFPIPPLPHG